ncbi:MAG TPA: 50S ribosomal protein L9 [Phycisphaerales bacterium]|nr:50S ribosomal protein L9 [Phycisphaerales bacterium]
MAAKKVQLLLNKTVENLGIVGDVVKVRPGFARNYLLPLAIAEKPTPSKIERLKAAREAALAELAQLRKDREGLLERMHAVTVTIVRSCNDQGILYGSVSQRDIADALAQAGYDVGIRAVRLSQTIRRVGEYHVPIQFDKDLRTDITLKVDADRVLEEAKEEVEIDEEGNPIEKKQAGVGGIEGERRRGRKGEAEAVSAESEAKPAAETKPETPKSPKAMKKDKAAKP